MDRRPAATVALLALVLAGCALDRYESSYPTFVAARQQDAVDRGWIPDLLPEESTDLREVHDIDTNAAVVRATVPGGIMPDACVETEDPGDPVLTASWIPSDVASSGTSVTCGIWSGVLDADTLWLWTDRADEADPK